MLQQTWLAASAHTLLFQSKKAFQLRKVKKLWEAVSTEMWILKKGHESLVLWWFWCQWCLWLLYQQAADFGGSAQSFVADLLEFHCEPNSCGAFGIPSLRPLWSCWGPTWEKSLYLTRPLLPLGVRAESTNALFWGKKLNHWQAADQGGISDQRSERNDAAKGQLQSRMWKDVTRAHTELSESPI